MEDPQHGSVYLGWLHHPHKSVIICLICFRAVLEDSSNGSLPVDDPLWNSDSCVHLSHRIRLQKCQVPSEAQVSISSFRPPTKSMVQYVTISPLFLAETVVLGIPYSKQPQYNIVKISSLNNKIKFHYVIVKLCISSFHRIALKRSEAVTREVMRKVADDKKMAKQEKDER